MKKIFKIFSIVLLTYSQLFSIKEKKESPEIDRIEDHVNYKSPKILTVGRYVNFRLPEGFNKACVQYGEYLPCWFHDQITSVNNLWLKLKGGYDKIDSIGIASAKIRKLYGDEFSRVPNLKYLSLHTNIETLEPNSFADLKNLKELNLVSEQLTEIKPGAFSNLSNLDTLALYAEKISEISPAIFEGLDKLKHIIIFSKEITKLDTEIFDKLPKLKTIYLSETLRSDELLDYAARRDISLGFIRNINYNQLDTYNPELSIFSLRRIY